MIDILSSFIGLIVGVAVGGLGIYLLPYRTLRREQRATQAELAEIQSKNNGLQADLLDVQSTAYQNRQAALQQQKRLEEQLAEAGEQHLKLEKRIADLETQREQEQQTYLREATRLRGAVLRLESREDAPEKVPRADRIVLRHWNYRLSFPADANKDYVGGSVRIGDPWNATAPPITRPILLAPVESIVVAPERLIMKASQREARVLVRTFDRLIELTGSAANERLDVSATDVANGDSRVLFVRRRGDRPLGVGEIPLEVIATTEKGTLSRTVTIRVVED